jgi:hypothetical protein
VSVIAIIPLLVCLVGLLVYVLAVNNGKAAELGRLSFAMGLLVTLLVFAKHVVRL